MIGGLALVVIGVDVAWGVGGRSGDAESSTLVEVVVAKADLTPGEAGEDLIAAGKVAVEKAPQEEVAADAVRSTDELDDTILSAAVSEGNQVQQAALRSDILRGAAVEIPEGLQARAVTVPFTAGAAGYAGPGDRINIYVTIPPGADGAPVVPFTKLLLSDVAVLDVSDEVAPRRSEVVSASDGTTPTTQTARTEGEELTFLLALDAEQAEKVVFATSVNELWFTLVPEDQGVSATPGVGYGLGYLEGE